MNKLNREILGGNSKERENKKDDRRKKAFLSELQYGSEARYKRNVLKGNKTKAIGTTNYLGL